MLKFASDRRTWIKWLFEARKRYGLEVLNYKKIWTQAITAGSAGFVEGIKAKLGIKARHRRIQGKENGPPYTLRKPVAAYRADFEGKNDTGPTPTPPKLKYFSVHPKRLLKPKLHRHLSVYIQLNLCDC